MEYKDFVKFPPREYINSLDEADNSSLRGEIETISSELRIRFMTDI